ATNHKNAETKAQQDATCLEGGYTAGKYCPDCQTWIEGHQPIDAAGHNFSETTAATAATCTEAGNHAYKSCTVCNKFFAADAETNSTAAKDSADAFTVGALNHNYSTTFTVDKKATCTEAGSKSKHCSRCTSTTEVTVIPVREHKLVDTTVEKAATCTADGVMNQKCSNTATDEYEACTYTTTRVIPATNHKNTLIRIGAQAPTCEENGWEAYEYCRACDYTTYKAIPALGHDYVSAVTKEPTCTEKGVKTYTCENDGTHTYTEAIDALGHMDENGDNVCDRCGSGEACDHIWLNATCSTPKKCKKCGATEGKPLDHDHEGQQWRTYKAATCIEDGEEHLYCNDDDTHYIVRVIPATGHNYESTVVPAKCKTDGYISYKCTECKASYDEYYTTDDDGNKVLLYPATGHQLTGAVTAPTCDTDGYTVYSCTQCDYSYTGDTVPANHPDADKDGYCDDCKDSLVSLCKCYCHGQGWLARIIYKILRFLWKLFKVNATCGCGVVHY
ncbi:MAG: hypothetical protein IKV21_05745, partial [Clostridia bacterium]|nr:hypothetical protein [Clostridia bacterium]